MTSIAWKVNRLRTMGLAEILYRVRQAGRSLVEERGIGLAPDPVPEHSGRCGKPWLAHMPERTAFASDDYIVRADNVLAGRFCVFALTDAQLGFPPDWSRDPKTGTRAPQRFGKTLNYRDNDLVGDIKYLWEPNRHLELVNLAQAWYLTGDEKYLHGARILLQSWFAGNPYPIGVNWTSSLESAIRLINWSFAWHIFGGWDSSLFHQVEGEIFKRQWIDSIYQHSFFISHHFSRFSSANNHLIGEYAGLFIASVTWPLWKESDRWRVLAKNGLEREILAQNAADGGNREQGVWYQHEVADMFILCALAGRTNGVEFSPEYWSMLERSLDFIASLMDYNGNIPMIGDSDDAVIVDLSPRRDVYRTLLATGAVLFERTDFKMCAVQYDDKSRWLLGDDGASAFQALAHDGRAKPGRRAFVDSGYYLLGSNFRTPSEIRMVADAGPLGYLSIAAHGHADALSLMLSVAGQEILIDPGTYAYHTEADWRDYFKGTSAHNTLRVDALDQSVSGGNFMWNRHARAECLEFRSEGTEDVWVAWHDGYRRLADPVTHRRRVIFDKRSATFAITDTLECMQRHEVELYWHCAEHCRAVFDGDAVKVTVGEVALLISMPGNAFHADIVCGQEKPPLGWVSRRFDEKLPSPTIRWTGSIKGACTLETVIKVSQVAG